MILKIPNIYTTNRKKPKAFIKQPILTTTNFFVSSKKMEFKKKMSDIKHQQHIVVNNIAS